MFLKVSDKIKNIEWFVLHDFCETKFKQECSKLYDQMLNNTSKNTTIEFTLNTCKIYENSLEVKKGWIYNSSNNIKTLLYEITTLQENVAATCIFNKTTRDSDSSDSSEVDAAENDINVSYGSGYSPNIVSHGFSAQLHKEILKRMLEPNFGLRKI